MFPSFFIFGIFFWYNLIECFYDFLDCVPTATYEVCSLDHDPVCLARSFSLLSSECIISLTLSLIIDILWFGRIYWWCSSLYIIFNLFSHFQHFCLFLFSELWTFFCSISLPYYQIFHSCYRFSYTDSEVFLLHPSACLNPLPSHWSLFLKKYVLNGWHFNHFINFGLGLRIMNFWRVFLGGGFSVSLSVFVGMCGHTRLYLGFCILTCFCLFCIGVLVGSFLLHPWALQSSGWCSTGSPAYSSSLRSP